MLLLATLKLRLHLRRLCDRFVARFFDYFSWTFSLINYSLIKGKWRRVFARQWLQSCGGRTRSALASRHLLSLFGASLLFANEHRCEYLVILMCVNFLGLSSGFSEVRRDDDRSIFQGRCRNSAAVSGKNVSTFFVALSKRVSVKTSQCDTTLVMPFARVVLRGTSR